MNIAASGHSAADVMEALHDGGRKVAFRYELLDAYNQYKRDMRTIREAEVAFDAESAIMRTARFYMRDDGDIDYLSNRVRPVMRLRVKGTWAEWPLGVFLLSSPKRTATGRRVYREVEAYDTTLTLRQDRLEARLFIPCGTLYADAIMGVLVGGGARSFNIRPSYAALMTDREWPPGTPRLEIINALLSEINYTPLHADERGIFIADHRRDVTPDNCEYVYTTQDKSVIFDGATEDIDYFDTPNRFIAIVSNPDLPLMTATYTNDDPLSPLSTLNRGRVIMDEPQMLEHIASRAELARYVELWARERSRVYSDIAFKSALMPFHGYRNIYAFEHDALGIAGVYEELSWSMPLYAGAQMAHTARRHL